MITAQRKMLSETCDFLSNALDNLDELQDVAGEDFNDSLAYLETAIANFFDEIHDTGLI